VVAIAAAWAAVTSIGARSQAAVMVPKNQSYRAHRARLVSSSQRWCRDWKRPTGTRHTYQRRRREASAGSTRATKLPPALVRTRYWPAHVKT